MNADINVLKKDLATAINRNTGYRRENKKKAEKVVVISAALSAITTVAIALSSLFQNFNLLFQTLALFMSASLTIISAWDGFYNHKRLWLLQADILNRLYNIDAEIRHLDASGALDQSATNELYLRYQTAFREFNSQWKEMRTDESNTTNA